MFIISSIDDVEVRILYFIFFLLKMFRGIIVVGKVLRLSIIC